MRMLSPALFMLLFYLAACGSDGGDDVPRHRTLVIDCAEVNICGGKIQSLKFI